MSPNIDENPFEEPAFLEGLEAAGYLQRLDVSEARITARFQHALTKMQFAAHSEEFLTRAGVRKVHGSTVQFFNESPVSDPFVHVMVGSLPPNRQALVTPHTLPTSGWTPIGSPDEQDGTMHFTVSHPGFWPVTVILDSNPAHIAREDKYASIRDTQASDTDSDPEAYLRSARSARGSSSRRPVPGINSSDSSSESDVPPVRRTASAGGYRSSGGNGRASRAMSQRAMDEYASGDNGLDDYGRAAAGSSSRQGLVRSASRARSSRG